MLLFGLSYSFGSLVNIWWDREWHWLLPLLLQSVVFVLVDALRKIQLHSGVGKEIPFNHHSEATANTPSTGFSTGSYSVESQQFQLIDLILLFEQSNYSCMIFYKMTIWKTDSCVRVLES